MANNKTVIIIAGPTAVGKTTVAINVARHFNTEIISADSRQCYNELNIGVARPSIDELNKIQHHFIASHSILDKVNAVTFERYALEKVNGIFEKNDVVVMVGGTGLYIKAFCEGLDEMPVIPDDLRNKLTNDFKDKGLEWLQQQVLESDPVYYKSGEIKNPHRLLRAFEIKQFTGKSILELRKGKKVKRDFKIRKIAFEISKEQLHSNINNRVDKMIEMGLENEVKTLLPYQDLPSLQTVGYKEMFSYLRDEISLNKAIELIKKNTRQYAKRQMTWFKKDDEFEWFSPNKINEIISSVKYLHNY